MSALIRNAIGDDGYDDQVLVEEDEEEEKSGDFQRRSPRSPGDSTSAKVINTESNQGTTPWRRSVRLPDEEDEVGCLAGPARHGGLIVWLARRIRV